MGEAAVGLCHSGRCVDAVHMTCSLVPLVDLRVQFHQLSPFAAGCHSLLNTTYVYLDQSTKASIGDCFKCGFLTEMDGRWWTLRRA